MVVDENILIPGPSFHIDLATLDACHPVHYSRRLLIFRSKSSAQQDVQLAAFKIGLQRLVLRCPILGGIIVPPLPEDINYGKENWRTILPHQGIELIVRDLRTKIPSLDELEESGFQPQDFPYELLVPIPEDIDNDRPFAACKMQFSAINGGTIITFSMSHSVGDGAATNELMRILSKETKLADEHSYQGTTHEEPSVTESTAIGLDRTVLRNMTSEVPFDIQDHPGYRWQTPYPPDALSPDQLAVQSFKSSSPEIPVLLRISTENLVQLKTDATLPAAPLISTHDALSALIWRSMLFIRSRRLPIAENLPGSTRGSIFMPSDARRHLDLPPSYVGNAVYQLRASLDLGTLLSPSGLQQGASAIRRAITAVKPSLVASYVAKTRETWVDWRFPSTMFTTGVAMGTDWTSSELYGHDWGEAFGPLLRYRYPKEAFNCIMPKLPDGAAELMVSVMPEEVEVLKNFDCFGKYI